MEKSPRTLAILAYLLPIIGPLYILLGNRKNLFAVYHACQSLALAVAAVVIPLAWIVISWSISWIRLVGPVLVVSFFALVMAAWLVVIIAWVMGFVNVLQGIYRRVPIFGQWGEAIFFRLNAEEVTVAPQESQEATI